jgi:hypothetical protein
MNPNSSSDSSVKKRGRPRKEVERSDDDPMGLEWEMKPPGLLEEADIDVNDIDGNSEEYHEPQRVEVARTLNEFHSMISICIVNGEKEMLASANVLKSLLKHNYDPKAGHMIYQDVFVYEEGRKAEVQKKLGLTLEEKLFGHSKVGVSEPISKANDINHGE